MGKSGGGDGRAVARRRLRVLPCRGVSMMTAFPYGKRFWITADTLPAIMAFTGKPSRAILVSGSRIAKSTP